MIYLTSRQDPCCSANEQMEKDRMYLSQLETQTKQALLRFYSWEKLACTYGIFARPEILLNLTSSQELDLAQRPTGGGILFHGKDLCFSCLIPKSFRGLQARPLLNYHWINQLVIEALKDTLFFLDPHGFSLFTSSCPSTRTPSSFCFSQPTVYDILYQGKKCVGAAQRQTRFGLLHQSSIYLLPYDDLFLKKSIQDVTFLDLFKRHSFYLLEQMEGEIQRKTWIEQFQLKLSQEFKKVIERRQD